MGGGGAAARDAIDKIIIFGEPVEFDGVEVVDVEGGRGHARRGVAGAVADRFAHEPILLIDPGKVNNRYRN